VTLIKEMTNIKDKIEFARVRKWRVSWLHFMVEVSHMISCSICLSFPQVQNAIVFNNLFQTGAIFDDAWMKILHATDTVESLETQTALQKWSKWMSRSHSDVAEWKGM
jgi:hypothetical protein